MGGETPHLPASLGFGDHICLLYSSAAEQMATVAPFVQEGLSRGERCVYVTETGMEDVSTALAAAKVDVPSARHRGALVFLGKWQFPPSGAV